jgi:hypothetical protein
MSLVPIAAPQTESELAVILCLLEADGIPAFVHNGAFGSLHPGPQIPLYNARRVMVPSACRENAAAALLVLEPPLPDRSTRRDKLRIVIELILFGWFIPGSRRRHDEASSDTGEGDESTDEIRRT